MRENLQGDFIRKNIRQLYEDKILRGIYKRISNKFLFPMSCVICGALNPILKLVF